MPVGNNHDYDNRYGKLSLDCVRDYFIGKGSQTEYLGKELNQHAFTIH